MSEPEDLKTLERERVILEHLSGRLTATQAALALGVSRKTFYEWLERALSAMRAALRDRPGGRPLKPMDPENERLREELAVLEKERLVLASRLRIQDAFRQTFDEMEAGTPQPKKKRPM